MEEVFHGQSLLTDSEGQGEDFEGSRWKMNPRSRSPT
jgi:hypothetical protein